MNNGLKQAMIARMVSESKMKLELADLSQMQVQRSEFLAAVTIASRDSVEMLDVSSS